jgi:hypothetical protein
MAMLYNQKPSSWITAEMEAEIAQGHRQFWTPLRKAIFAFDLDATVARLLDIEAEEKDPNRRPGR